MTQFNVVLLNDEARILTETGGYHADGRPAGDTRKYEVLDGAVLVGRGANAILSRMAELIRTDGHTSVDTIADDLLEIADEAYSEQLKAGQDGLPEHVSLANVDAMVRKLVEDGDDNAKSLYTYEAWVVGYSERNKAMLAVGASYWADELIPIHPPYCFGNQPEVIRVELSTRCPGAAPDVPTQAAILRKQHHADMAYARQVGDRFTTGGAGGNIVLTRVTADGGISHETVGPLVEQARSRKVGRNDPCPCGSGRKFKRCCVTGER